MKIKTIDIKAREWFDKLNGNSYFSVIIILNYNMRSEKTINIPFQYGYGDHYIDITGQELNKQGYIKLNELKPLWRYCKDNNIILRTDKKENCLKGN